ncbi:hypothetical protein Y032_0451g1691 [Ancylostoma ceylanicum]|uniref:Uncharacterized protein n=1 Tax=Ancylostoma ceylanicum TaxID=53326 RepID=A0A016WY39_9BILA|nr:hypothetical protein Y032_0451g1691 [Ancylostoma ceylanicum]
MACLSTTTIGVPALREGGAADIFSIRALPGLFLVRPFGGPEYPAAVAWLQEEREECPSSSVDRPDRQCCGSSA